MAVDPGIGARDAIDARLRRAVRSAVVTRGQMVNGFDGASEGLDPRLRELLRRRNAVLGPAYRLFYEQPVHVVRGAGVHLYDADGREYLDAYNNVPSVGHAHPHVVEAITRQAAGLNTHTRYASEGLVAYAERLVATHDPVIERVMLTCTGSEAVDLALRIATFRGDRRGVIVTANAYHGVTGAVAAISPSLGTGVPIGTHVRTVPAPRTSPGGDPAAELAAAVEGAIADLRRHGIEPAAFVADSVFSSDGLWPEPALGPAVDAVRAAGALYVADEVQAGFARTGEAMWGYQRHGVEPDMVVMGKPMGNGMPIAGVAARGALLEEFGTAVRYFNTFGGNSVSVAAADAVLDVIEREGLAENAVRVGGYLRSGLQELAAGSPLLGDVRGAGLFLAVDIVDPQTGTPSAELAARVVNGARERGVLISATGAEGETLKIRPLLPFQAEHADQVVATLSDVAGSVVGRG